MYLISKILIIKLDHIGDLALALPVCRDLAAASQGGKIDLVVSPVNAGWREVLPWVDNLYTVQFPGYQSGRGKRRGRLSTLWNLLKLALKLRSNKYRVAIDLRTVSGDWRGKLVAWLSGAKTRIGGEGIGRQFLTDAVQESGVHESEMIRYRIESHHGKLAQVDEPVTTVRRMRPKGVLRLVIHPGAGFASKMWPLEHWIELRKLLSHEMPHLEIVWLGAEKERSHLKELESSLPGVDTFVISGTIRETLQTLADADLLVGLDSAAPHMAALVDTPAVTIFSAANNMERWKAGGQNRVLYHQVDCAPCYLRQCKWPEHPCMSGINPQGVLQAIREILINNKG